MDKEHNAIELIKMASNMSIRYYEKHIVCTYSGGKDSDVLLELFCVLGLNLRYTIAIPRRMHHRQFIIFGINSDGWKKKGLNARFNAP